MTPCRPNNDQHHTMSEDLDNGIDMSQARGGHLRSPRDRTRKPLDKYRQVSMP